jgi:hypothetical protein
MAALNLPQTQDGQRAARAYVYGMDMFSLQGTAKPDEKTQHLVAQEVMRYVQEQPWTFDVMLKGNQVAAGKLLDVFKDAEARALSGELQPGAIRETAAGKPWNLRNGRLVVFELPDGVDPSTTPAAGTDSETGLPFWNLDDVWNTKQRASTGPSIQGWKPGLVYPAGGGKGELRIALQRYPKTPRRQRDVADWISKAFRLRAGGFDVKVTSSGLYARPRDENWPDYKRVFSPFMDKNLTDSIVRDVFSGYYDDLIHLYDWPGRSIETWKKTVARLPSDLRYKYSGTRNLQEAPPKNIDFVFLGRDGMVRTTLTSKYVWSEPPQPAIDWTKVRD